MTKIKATAIHLAISSVIFFVLLYFIAVLWYPQPYFAADGGWQGIKIIFGVDIVLGPVLTFIVFKPNKPGLKMDLSIIAVIQFFALIWGIWTVYDQKTTAVLFTNTAFHTLNAAQVRTAGFTEQSIQTFSAVSPPLIYLQLPLDKKQRRLLVNKVMLHQGKPLYLFKEDYRKIMADNLKVIFSYSINLKFLAQHYQEINVIWQQFVTHYGTTVDDYAYIQLFARYHSIILVMQRSDGKIVDTIDLDLSAYSSLPYGKLAIEHNENGDDNQ